MKIKKKANLRGNQVRGKRGKRRKRNQRSPSYRDMM